MPRYLKKANPNLCSKCKVNGPPLRRGWCNKCRSKSKKKYWEEHREQIVEYKFKRKYGISLAKRDQMMIEQEFRCAACERTFNLAMRPSVDHCHNTSTIRGIICSNCNLALGLMKENPELIHKLAAYAERIKSKK
jgi:hypothetical protein